ncbi:MAG: hypothetical protein BROFUL_00201 [Candidatus Brocadia fulgida]|uniref:Uncharacterized protein n=1 Tax=Candidatus Brocadia fulgida TaxID=380242 RepID=A0A0M2V305_9BACT|nr:MAG: hypothetical protein BROFUL_00201 [Candidatus Brocadia fulgida]MBV6518295.1 hypothetical protein [Candidatus Brocadia fulgida]
MRKFCSMGSECLVVQISINTNKDGVTQDHEIIQLAENPGLLLYKLQLHSFINHFWNRKGTII